jgi:drug/metabolite transporter (DMT)-like permease
MTNLLLYVVTVFFWGTSWLAIRYQLGVVVPEVSIVYRFGIAAAIMLVFCAVARRPMRFRPREHAFMALQALLMFSTNYVLVYLGTQHLTTGLVAVAFSTTTVMTIIGGSLVFGFPVRARVVAGAAFGLAGLGLVFWPEVRGFDVSRGAGLGMALALTGTFFAACGMLTSARNQRAGLPVIQTNAWGMTYGFVFVTAYSLARGHPFAFDLSFPYVFSLLYLAIGATVLAFWTYLTLLGRIGPARAAYASVLFPIIALALSTAFEGYRWGVLAAAGVALVLLGNVLVLTRGARRG